MGYFARIGDDIRQWVAAAMGLGKNPLADWFMLLDSRRESRVTFWSRYSPLFIALLPSVFILLLGFWDKATNPYNEIEPFITWAVFAFVATAYLVWMARGIYTAILDSMALLNRSTKPTTSLSLDDLMLVTTVSDREIVVAAMRLITPQLWIKTIVGIALLVGAYAFLVSELWMPGGWINMDFDDEVVLTLVLSPLTIASLAVPALIGTLAGLLYYLSLGEGRTMVPASIASIVVLMGQGLWLMGGTSIAVLLGFEGMGGPDPDPLFCYACIVGSALLYIALLALALKTAAAAPMLRSLFAIGSPILFHISTAITVAMASVLLAMSSQVLGNHLDNQNIPMAVMSFVMNMGNMLPLNPTAIPSFSMLGQDATGGFYSPYARLLAYPLLIVTQLVSLLLCANQAKLAVKRRRQARNA